VRLAGIERCKPAVEVNGVVQKAASIMERAAIMYGSAPKESFYMKARWAEHERDRRKTSTERDAEAARRRIVERGCELVVDPGAPSSRIIER